MEHLLYHSDFFKALSLAVSTKPEGSRRLKFPGFLDNRNMKVVSLSALVTAVFTPLPPRLLGDNPGTHSC
jgi:hypothetical protein